MPIRPDDFDAQVPPTPAAPTSPLGGSAADESWSSKHPAFRSMLVILGVLLAIATIIYFANEISDLETQLRAAQATVQMHTHYDNDRAALADKWPVVIADIQLSNTDGNGNSLQQSGPDEFASDQLKYLTWHIRGPNEDFANQDISGSLGVKYFRPDGTLDSSAKSPEGYTEAVDLSIPRTKAEWDSSLGWGTSKGGSFKPGIWTLQFWWGGRQIGEKTFRVD